MFRRLRVVAALLALACSSTDAAVGGAACVRDIDCPADQRCASGTCAPIATGGCTANDQCPAGHLCLPSGVCEKAECLADADCCPAEAVEGACARVCQDFQCYGQDCADGATKECFVACHRGERECVRGEFEPCDAAPVSEEACDNAADDDCDGETDEGCAVCQPGEVVPCTTPCGAGEATCTPDGQLGACSAPTDCACGPGETTSRPCGLCGTEGAVCGVDGTFVYSGVCAGEGTCEPSKAEWRPCGQCGNQTRFCGADCTPGEWSECTNEGECEPGAVEERGCTGACGVERRECGDDCTFGDWSSCDETGGCSQGEVQTQSCGLCGTRTATCDAECQWGAFGACEAEGECSPAAIETEPCGACGERTRTCSAGCGWGAWSECDGEGECVAGTTEPVVCGPDSTDGPCTQGTATRVCGPSCTWGAAGACVGAVYPVEELCGDAVDQDCDGADDTLPDDWEPNNTCATCAFLGTDPDVNLYATFDSPGDTVDYYCFNAVDDFNVIGFGEDIDVNVMNQSAGIAANLYLYKGTEACKGGTTKAIAKAELPGTADDPLQWGETTGTDDNGLYILEVRNTSPKGAGCYKAYTLRVDGLN